MSDKLAENEFSPHPHLPVHQHRQQPVAEGGEFLVLIQAQPAKPAATIFRSRSFAKSSASSSSIRFTAPEA